MKKEKTLNFIIPLVVYPFEVMVSVNETNEALRSRLSKLGFKDDDIRIAMVDNKTVRGRSCMFSNNSTLIRLMSYPKDNKDYSCLQHEIFHVVTFITECIGMPLAVGTSCEAYAYLIQYLTEEIYDRL